MGKGWLWIPWFVALAFALLSALTYFTNLRLKNDLLAIRSDAKAREVQLAQSRAMLQILNSSESIRASLSAEGESKKPTGEAVYSPEDGNLVLVVGNLPPVSAEKVYQAWLLPEQGHAISAGTFRTDDRGSAALVKVALPSGLRLKGFGVSLEPRGGTETPSAMLIKGSALK